MSELSIRAAKGHSPGYAWIGAGTAWADGAHVVIKRLDSDKRQFLGPTDWQDEPVQLPVVDHDVHNGLSLLLLGPSICDRLQPSQWFDIAVIENGQRHDFEAIIWPGSRALRDPHEAGPKLPPPPPPPPLKPDHQKLPEKDDVVVPAETVLLPRKRRIWPWLLALLLLLAACAAAAAYYLRTTPNCTLWPISCQPGLAQAVTPTTPTTAVDQAAAAATPTTEPSAAAAPHADGPAEWRAIIADDASSPQQLIDLGLQLRALPFEQQRYDIGYEALWAAADGAQSPAAQKLIAQATDPLAPDLPPGSVNAATALTYYRRTSDAGDADSTQRLEALCAWAASQTGAAEDAIREPMESNCE